MEEMGHDVRRLGVGNARGLADEEVIAEAVADDRMIVTFDLDFGRLYYFHYRGRVGILVPRLHRLTYPGQEDRLREFLLGKDLESRGLEKSLVVLEPNRYRVLR